MRLVKNIAIIVLSLSIALVGIPAHAHQEYLGHSDTQHHVVKIANDTQDVKPCCDHADKKPCCGKGKMCCKEMCKCPGGNCNGSFSGIFGNGNGDLRNLASSYTSFGYAEEYIESAYLSRLKRPPKA